MPDCRAPIVLAFFAVAALAGCARHPAVAPVAAEAPPEPIPPRPELGYGYGAVTPPPRDADGHYRTINSGLTPEQAAWHLRAALNVAAIGCRGAADAGITPAYNIMLSSKRAVLADANRAVQARFRTQAGAAWQTESDAFMTRLYNFFAMPAAKPGFCAAADTIAPQAAATPPAEFAGYAATALPQIEAPITDVFAVVDQYRMASAAWDARYGPDADRTRLAAAAPAPAMPVASPAAPAPLLALAAMPGQARMPAGAPQLGYADLAPMLAWEPRAGQALALR